jgi:uncharacterized protein
VLYHPPRILPEGYELPELARLINESSIPVVIVRGNCDSEVYEELLQVPVQAPYAFIQQGDLRIVVTHGHLMDREATIRAGRKYNASVLISGHTHVPVLEKNDGMVVMNPGSASLPKFEKDGKPTGSVGIITENSIRIVSIEDGSVIFQIDTA